MQKMIVKKSQIPGAMVYRYTAKYQGSRCGIYHRIIGMEWERLADGRIARHDCDSWHVCGADDWKDVFRRYWVKLWK